MSWPWIENIIVALLLAASAFYLGMRTYRSVFTKKPKGCICESCPSSASCGSKKGERRVKNESQ